MYSNMLDYAPDARQIILNPALLVNSECLNRAKEISTAIRKNCSFFLSVILVQELRIFLQHFLRVIYMVPDF